SGAVAAAVKEQQHPRGVAARDDRPLPGDAADVHCLHQDLVRDGPDGSYLVEALPSVRPAGGTRLGSQHLPNGLDLTPRHCLLVPRVAVERTPGVSTQAISPQQVNASCSKPGFGALEYPRPGLGAGCRGGHSGVRAVGGGTPMNRTSRVVALILRRLGFLALAPLCGCALNTVHVSPPMTELTTDASLGAGRVVLV